MTAILKYCSDKAEYYTNLSQTEHKNTARAYDEGRKDAYNDIYKKLMSGEVFTHGCNS